MSTLFSMAEFERRAHAMQSRMATAGMDALLLTQGSDIFYLTGFLTRFWESPARPWFVILPSSGAPIAVIPAIGAALMSTTWVRDIRTWDAPDPVDDGLSLLIETLHSCGPVIGTPMGLETHLRMPLADYRRMAGSVQMVDATDVVQSVREVKSEAEIQKIRAVCSVADAAFAQVPDIIATTPLLDQIFRRFQMSLLDHSADWVSYTAGGAGPEGYGDVISPAAPVPLQTGDILMLDTGSVRDGYFCDFDRNFAIGAPSDRVRQVHHALYDATQVALDHLRPGMRASDAHGVMAKAIEGAGHRPCGGRLGHGLGITLTEWPSFTPKDKTVLRAGMVLTLEPSAEVVPGRILVHEENIVLRDDGPELLNVRAPRDMPVIEI